MKRNNLFQFEFLLVCVLGVEILVFSKTGTNFATQGNMFEILRLSTEIGLLALVMTPIILTGGIDLSVGSMLGLSAVLFGKMWRDIGMPPALAAVCTLVLGALGGGLNALLITRLKLPPLIVTLGSFSLFRGLAEALTRGVGSFQILVEHNRTSMQSFDPPREIVGRFSANFPMPWIVYCDQKTGAFGIKGSSPGSVTTPEYNRQVAINGLLGGKVLACFTATQTRFTLQIEEYILAAGFEPNNVAMSEYQLSSLIGEIEKQGLWDDRRPHNEMMGEILLASPWGFRWIFSPSDFDTVLSEPVVDFQIS